MKNKNNIAIRKSIATLFAASTLAAVISQSSLAAVAPVNNIRVNQHGYLPSQPKVAVYIGPANARWELKTKNGEILASGRTKDYGYDVASGDNVSHIDFSAVTTTRRDLTLTIGNSSSYPFDISPYTYKSLKEDALTYFYHQRFGEPVLAEYVGEEFSREAGHLMDKSLACDDNLPRDWNTSSHCSYSLDVSGGHADAGDYGGYVVNGGYYTWLLQYVFEAMPTSFPDGSIPIPESNNGIPDILDEARVELDFILRMQVPQDKAPYPGMIHHKKSWQDWAPFPLVPADDNGLYWGNPLSKRTIKPVTTAATLNGAATMAQAARLWANFPDAPGFNNSSTPYHETLITQAEIAWQAAVDNPALYASTDALMGSGPYDDRTVSDEFYWAAVELYLTTKKAKYKNFLINSPHFAKYSEFDWKDTHVAGNLSLLLHKSELGFTGTQVQALQQGLIDFAEKTLTTVNNEGYLTPLAAKNARPSGGVCNANVTYPWGSVGSFVLSNSIQMAAAYKLTNNRDFIDGVTQSMDHVLGTNALDRSYITGYGENATKEPHHRFWLKSKGNPVTAVAAGVAVPYPGAVAGGPQNDFVEDGTSGPETNGTPCSTPAKSFADHWNNYSSNEITVNWNANLTAVMAFIDDAFPAPVDKQTPTPPQELQAISTSGSSIQVSWSDAQDNNRIRQYYLFMKKGAGNYKALGSTKFTQFDVVPLEPNQRYCFRIAAQDYAGYTSARSKEECATTDAAQMFEIYYQPDNSAMSDYVGTGAKGQPEAPKAILGNGWYQYSFHTNPDFSFHFSMPNWGSPQRFSPTGGGQNWRINASNFSADGAIWLTSDKVFHKAPPAISNTLAGCEPNCPGQANTPPFAVSQSVPVDQNSSVMITLKASDSDGQVKQYQITKSPAHGTLALTGNQVNYQTDSNYVGDDSFAFVAVDDQGATSNEALISIDVRAVAPEAADQLCTVAAQVASKARVRFENKCPEYTNPICKPLSIGSTTWTVCSSIDSGIAQLPIVNDQNNTTIEAENYARAIDTTTGNIGGAYRAGDVDIQKTSDGRGGYSVGWISAGEVLHYDVLVDVPGVYNMVVRTASPNDGGRFNVLIDGIQVVSNHAVAKTGSWTSFASDIFALEGMNRGSHTITIEVVNGHFNLNWLRLKPIK